MKKLLAVFLSLILALALCGCNIKEAAEMLGGKFSLTEIETVEEYYIVSPEYNACYNSLNKQQKSIYKILYSAALQMPDGFFRLCKSYDGIKTDIAIAYNAVINDHVEIFWMPQVYLVSEMGFLARETVVCFNNPDGDKKVSYTVSKEQRSVMEKALEEEVEEILQNAKIYNTEYQKEKYFNDYICENTEYDKEAPLGHTVFGALVSGKALCEGYAKAFKLLCNKADIECDLIVGEAEDVGHMWNSVNIDGKHSFVDVTWNDQENERYTYFNITGEQLTFDHTLLPVFKEIEDENALKTGDYNFFERECSYIGNSYFVKEARYLSDNSYHKIASEAIKQDALNKRESVFMLSTDQKEAFLKDDMGYIAKIQNELSGIILEKYAFERDILVLFFSVLA